MYCIFKNIFYVFVSQKITFQKQRIVWSSKIVIPVPVYITLMLRALNSFDGIIAFFTAMFSLRPLNLLGHRHFFPSSISQLLGTTSTALSSRNSTTAYSVLDLQLFEINILKIDLIHLCKSHKWQSMRVIHKLNKHNMHVNTIIYLCLYASRSTLCMDINVIHLYLTYTIQGTR